MCYLDLSLSPLGLKDMITCWRKSRAKIKNMSLGVRTQQSIFEESNVTMISFLWKHQPRELSRHDNIGKWEETGIRKTSSQKEFMRSLMRWWQDEPKVGHVTRYGEGRTERINNQLRQHPHLRSHGWLGEQGAMSKTRKAGREGHWGGVNGFI